MPEQVDVSAGGSEFPGFTTPDCVVIAIDPATDFMLLETIEAAPRRVLFGLSQYAGASGVEAERFEPGAVIRWSVPDVETDLTGKITLIPPEEPSGEDTSAIITEHLKAGRIN